MAAWLRKIECQDAWQRRCSVGSTKLIAMDYRRWGTAVVWNCTRLVESMTVEIHTLADESLFSVVLYWSIGPTAWFVRVLI